MEVRCPRCGRDFVRQVRREGLAEIVAAAAGLHSFACQLCAHRFRAWQWSLRHATPSIDRRQHERICVNFPMSFSTDSGGGNGTTLDISMGGCGFKTEPPPAPGAVVTLELHAPGLEHPLIVDAAVVRSVRSIYTGVEFLRLSPKEQYRLTQFVANTLTDRRLKDDATSRRGRLNETGPVPQVR